MVFMWLKALLTLRGCPCADYQSGTAANPTQIAGKNVGEATSAASQPPISNHITSFLDISLVWKVAQELLDSQQGRLPLPETIFFSNSHFTSGTMNFSFLISAHLTEDGVGRFSLLIALALGFQP